MKSEATCREVEAVTVAVVEDHTRFSKGLAQASLLSPSNPGADWRVVSVADRNGDGKPDLLFQHTNLDLALWLMDGMKLGSAQYLNPRNPGGTWTAAAP